MALMHNNLKLKAYKYSMIIATMMISLHASAEPQKNAWVPVTGKAIHYFTTAVKHSEVPTDTGNITYSTDTIDISGDVNGRVIYHVASVFNAKEQTIRNTGHQVFSGTVLGSDPVLLLDDEFEFNINLVKGETIGKVFLRNSLAGKNIECVLNIVGTGFTEQGDGLAEYTGKCRGHDK